MSIEDELSEGLLARYFAGECSADEIRRIQDWVAEDPKRQTVVNQLRDTWRVFGHVDQPSFDVEAGWAKILRKPASKRLTIAPPWATTRISRRVAVAAALVITAGVGFWLQSRQDGAPPTSQAPLREVTTRPGQRADVYLSDGTHIVLGAASRVRFASPLTRTSRDVYLDGEALFVVVHRADWPFLVHTAHGITEDLGTKFSVRAYAADSSMSVAVAEGKVALRTARTTDSSGLVLTPGDLGTLTADGRLDSRHGIPLEPYLAWAEGRLVLRDTPLREALPQIARWYDLDLHVADPSLEAWPLTTTVTTESADELLRYLALALNARYERHGRSVTLYSKR